MDFSKSFISDEILSTHKLFLENDIYLEQCKSKSTTLDKIGLVRLTNYDKYTNTSVYSKKKNRKRASALKAVIPDNDQHDFLNSIGLTHESYIMNNNSLVNQSTSLFTSSAFTKKSVTSKKNYLMPIHNTSKLLPQSSTSRRKSSPPRLTAEGIPVYSQIPRRILDAIDKERDEAIERNKLMERLKKVGTHYDIVKDGVTLVYDRQGFLCSEADYIRAMEEENKEKVVAVVKSEGPFFEGTLFYDGSDDDDDDDDGASI